MESTAHDGVVGMTNERAPILWQCTDTDSRQRPYGKAPKAGCGRWNVMMTTLREGNRKHRWMGVCPCGKKRSLNPGKVYHYPDKDSAKNEATKRNRRGE